MLHCIELPKEIRYRINTLCNFSHNVIKEKRNSVSYLLVATNDSVFGTLIPNLRRVSRFRNSMSNDQLWYCCVS